MKTLDDAVIELNGVWPSKSSLCVYMIEYLSPSVWGAGSQATNWLFTKEQFEQRAKELGFVGRYRWGVVYKTDGKRPELADDAGVQVRNDIYAFWTCGHVGGLNWSNVYKFKITDQRHKPADTSYLDKPDSSTDNSADWYSYEMNVTHHPAPVGTKVLVDCHHQGMKEGVVIGAFQRWNWVDITGAGIDTFDMILVKPLDHDRKAEADRKRVVDAAEKYWFTLKGDITESFEQMYDKGFLRLPEDK